MKLRELLVLMRDPQHPRVLPLRPRDLQGRWQAGVLPESARHRARGLPPACVPGPLQPYPPVSELAAL